MFEQDVSSDKLVDLLSIKYIVCQSAFKIIEFTENEAVVEFDFTYTFSRMPEEIEEISYD